MRDARARDRKVRYYTRFVCENETPPKWTDYAENGRLLHNENDERVKICDKEVDVSRIYRLWISFMKDVTDAQIKSDEKFQAAKGSKSQSKQKVMNGGRRKGSRKKRKCMITSKGDDDDF